VEGLTYEKLRGDLSALTDEVVRVEMPLFQAQFRGSVKPVLAEMGVRLAFEPDRADFSPMTGGRERLRIDDVFHGAYIRADENGVVAAAATGVVMKPVCAKIGGVEVVVDRPFLFVLADRKTGAIYFIGHVVDPSR
jgi:serine protease inhibitor